MAEWEASVKCFEVARGCWKYGCSHLLCIITWWQTAATSVRLLKKTRQRFAFSMALIQTCVKQTKLVTKFLEHFSSAASQCAETFWASEPEADVCVRPVLEERPGQRGRQEQEVLLSQRKTPVSLSNPWKPQPLCRLPACLTKDPSPSWLRWTKDKRVVLVSSHERKKWTTVRSLPTKKPIPVQFEVFCFSFIAS